MIQVKSRENKESVIFVDEVDRVRSTSSIVAYKTSTRVSILVKETNGKFGFKYLEKFVYENRLYFESSTAQGSIQKALTKDGVKRNVFIFEDTNEFFNWATSNT